MATRNVRWLDGAGVLGALFAAFCCAGAPVIVTALAAAGLSALRRDSILWPLMLLSLVVALAAFASDARGHRRRGPLLLAIAGAVSLAAGVIVVHGRPAYLLIDAGAVALVVATIWNVRTRVTCGRLVEERLH